MADKYMVKYNEISYSQNIMSLFLVTDKHVFVNFLMLSIKCVPMGSIFCFHSVSKRRSLIT